MDRILLICDNCGYVIDMSGLMAECTHCGRTMYRYNSRTPTLWDEFAAWDALSDEAFHNVEQALEDGEAK